MSPFFQSILDRLAATFEPERTGEAVAVFLADLLTGLAVFAVFYVGWWILNRLLRAAFQRADADATLASIILVTSKFALLAFGLVQALAAVGINTASLIASLGIAGLTIGFAAQDALSNIISGILIFWDRPFVINDLVEVEGDYGRVDKITLRSTRVVTPDGRMLAVPNATVINSVVASYTNFPNLRLGIEVTVGVNEDLGRVRRLLLALVEGDPTFMDAPPPRVVVTALNDYNVALELQAWLRDEREHVQARFDLREQVFATLTEAGVDMPFETVQLRPVAGDPLDVRMSRAA
ncbi:MAG: mechanosensitive ion channel family protein [Bacteroidota bacterium]